MFRVTVLAIVVVLAASPLSPLLCRTWCDSTGAAAIAEETTHHHAASDIALVAGDDCVSPALDTMAFVREDTERFASLAGAHDGVVVSCHSLPRFTDIGQHIVKRSFERSFDRGPLSLSLRM